MRRAALHVAVVLATLLPRAAAAQLACDAGAVCPDKDNDGFAACGCPWSGTPCDCNDDDPAIFPGAPETCDSAKDNNCSGVAPDSCPKKKGCWKSSCVPECIPLDDFGCPGGSSFATEPDSGQCLCAPQDCTIFGCPEGQTCDDTKSCVPNCPPGVKCPHGQICRGFGCVDPCADVTCPQGAVCDRGLCLPSCACAPGSTCPPGESCDLTAPVPACVEPACVGVRCPPASHCVEGRCIDDCEGVVCPPKRVCKQRSLNGGPAQANCVDLCFPNPCKPGYACEWRTGGCTVVPIGDGGLTNPDNAVDPLEIAGAGWLCGTSASNLKRVAPASAVSFAFAMCIGGIAVAVALRRRRR